MTTPWGRIGEWRYSSKILDLSTRWKRVVSFTSLPLYPWGKIHRYPLDRRLGRPIAGLDADTILTTTENRTPALQPVARHYTDWAIENMETKCICFAQLFSWISMNSWLCWNYTRFNTIQLLVFSKCDVSKCFRWHKWVIASGQICWRRWNRGWVQISNDYRQLSSQRRPQLASEYHDTVIFHLDTWKWGRFLLQWFRREQKP
jgi:hypothetical protein